MLYVLPMVAALTVAVTTPFVGRLATRVGAVDTPGGRKRHTGAVPKFGGLAIFAALLLSFALAPALADDGSAALIRLLGPRWEWTVGGGLAALLVGLIDDCRPLSAFVKLAGQTVAASLAVAGGCVVAGITNPFGGPGIFLDWLSVPLTVVWIVLVINAVNLIDGLDGLAAGATVIICATIHVLAWIDGRPETALLAALLGAAAAGFLVHNWHPATIFLGDSGSLLLGYSLAVLSMQGLQKGPTATLLIAPILALGLPLLDTAATVVRRASASGIGSILRADDAHLHHRLLDLGLPHRRAVMTLYAACAAFGLVAIGVRNLHGLGQGLLVASVAVIVFFGTVKLSRGERSPAVPPRSSRAPE